jgi:hypothetical protein
LGSLGDALVSRGFPLVSAGNPTGGAVEVPHITIADYQYWAFFESTVHTME